MFANNCHVSVIHINYGSILFIASPQAGLPRAGTRVKASSLHAIHVITTSNTITVSRQRGHAPSTSNRLLFGGANDTFVSKTPLISSPAASLSLTSTQGTHTSVWWRPNSNSTVPSVSVTSQSVIFSIRALVKTFQELTNPMAEKVSFTHEQATGKGCTCVCSLQCPRGRCRDQWEMRTDWWDTYRRTSSMDTLISTYGPEHEKISLII